MAMLEYNEVRERKIIVWDGAPYEVISSHVFRKQQRKPVNATKIKNLLTGRVAEISFGSSEKVEEADIMTKTVKYLYTAKDEIWCSDLKDPSKRFTIKASVAGDKMRFIKANSEIDLIVFTDDEDEETIIGVKTPIKVELKVTEAPPAVKGNTATGGSKVITLETGATINAPLFIEEGETIRVNTDTGEYAERVGNSF